jgi:hypothetical protein
VGFGRVVQYGGLARGLQKGPVQEVPLTQLTRGYPLWVRSEESPCFDGEEIVRRALRMPIRLIAMLLTISRAPTSAVGAHRNGSGLTDEMTRRHFGQVPEDPRVQLDTTYLTEPYP